LVPSNEGINMRYRETY